MIDDYVYVSPGDAPTSDLLRDYTGAGDQPYVPSGPFVSSSEHVRDLASSGDLPLAALVSSSEHVRDLASSGQVASSGVQSIVAYEPSNPTIDWSAIAGAASRTIAAAGSVLSSILTPSQGRGVSQEDVRRGVYGPVSPRYLSGGGGGFGGYGRSSTTPRLGIPDMGGLLVIGAILIGVAVLPKLAGGR